MFKDTDLISVTCANCGDETEKAIGWLKTNAEFRCPGCGTLLHHDPEHFARHVLEEASRANGKVVLKVTRTQEGS